MSPFAGMTRGRFHGSPAYGRTLSRPRTERSKAVIAIPVKTVPNAIPGALAIRTHPLEELAAIPRCERSAVIRNPLDEVARSGLKEGLHERDKQQAQFKVLTFAGRVAGHQLHPSRRLSSTRTDGR